jgi:hypothetical protein
MASTGAIVPGLSGKLNILAGKHVDVPGDPAVGIELCRGRFELEKLT